MLSWLLVNVGLSLLALAFIFLNGGAPHRLRFFAGFAALAAWLVPWTLLPELPLAIDFSTSVEKTGVLRLCLSGKTAWTSLMNCAAIPTKSRAGAPGR